MFFANFFKREREGGKKGGREREKHWSAAFCMHPDQGSNQPPGYVCGPGTEPATFQLWDDALTN